MNRDEFQRLEELFFELEALAADERAARLDRLGDTEPALAEELRGLFAAESEERGRGITLLRTRSPVGDAAAAGALLVPGFRLDRKLGEGGMGVVWAAEQLSPIRRRVALKLVRAGADTRDVLERFETERQALALMEHPNIAKVFEAGTAADGRPFFAMELVEGVSISSYADEHRLDTSRRLRLFVEVCRAVQHAHRKGIIHRDIKPSNILVARVEGRPVPKIIDFGVAKAITPAADRGRATTLYGQLVGTPEYMSPEQIAGEPIDTRSDVYSLGVLLFVLLVGEPPISSTELGEQPEAMRRSLREREARKPSDRVDTTTAESRTTAERRGTEPFALRRELRGDLDWIALKALAHRPEDRYESAADLAADVERHLEHRPVVAGPPTLRYRTAKLLRRHRVAALVGGVLALALVLGVLGLALGLTRARRAEAAAQREARTAEEVLEVLRAGLAEGARAADQGQQLSIPELFAKAHRRLQEQPPADPLVHGTVLNRIAEFHMSLADYAAAERLFRSAEGVLRPAPNASSELSTTLYRLGVVARLRGDLDEASRLQAEAAELRGAIHSATSVPLLEVEVEQAQIAYARGDREQAIATMRRVLAASPALRDLEPGELVGQHLILATMLSQAGELEEAETLRRTALRMAEQEQLTDLVTVALNDLAVAAYRRGQLGEAAAGFERAYEITRDQLGADPYRLQTLVGNLGMLAARQARFERATELLEQALGLVGDSTGLDSSPAAAVRAQLAEVYYRASRYEDARRHLLVLTDLAYRFEPETPANGPLRVERTFARVEEAEGNVAAARRRLERAAAPPELQKRDGEGHCLLLVEAARLEPDRSRVERTLGDARQRCGDETWERPSVLYARASALARAGERAAALDLLDRYAGAAPVDAWPALDPALAPLRGEERFASFVERVRPH